MKITQLMLAQGFGGAERHFVDLSFALADKGYLVQAICHEKFQKRNELERHPNISVSPVVIRGAWDIFGYWRLKKLILSFAPEIIHAHLARGAYWGGKTAKSLHIPCVVNLHNYVNLKYYRNIDAFIAATEDQKRYLLDRNIPAARITVLPHFSPLPAKSATTFPTDRPLRFITLGRMVKKKGFDILLDAFKRCLNVGLDSHLIIGGNGPERHQLLQFAEKLGISNKIEFSGWVDNVEQFLSQGDIFVLPSLDEPFGIVMLEAMASGKPIISTRTQGPSSVLDEQTAFFAETGDAESLAQAMLKAAQDSEAAIGKAQAATQLYQTTYHQDAIVPKVEAIYRSLA